MYQNNCITATLAAINHLMWCTLRAGARYAIPLTTCYGLCKFSICFCESLTSTQCHRVGGHPSRSRNSILERSELQALLWSGHLNVWVAFVCSGEGKYKSQRHRIFSDVLCRTTPQPWASNKQNVPCAPPRLQQSRCRGRCSGCWLGS